MSNKVYTFNGIDAIIENPPEDLTARAQRSGKMHKTTKTNSKNNLVERFILNVKRFIDSIPDSVKNSHPKINHALIFLDQRIQYLDDPNIEPSAANKLLTEITNILIKEFETITNEISASIKEDTLQLIQDAVEIIKLHHIREIDKENRRLDRYFTED